MNSNHLESGGGKKQQQLLSSRIMSRDGTNMAANASFRVYYSLGAAGAVPFLWESKPGLPKGGGGGSGGGGSAVSGEAVVPPISPPPSYQPSFHEAKGGSKCRRKFSSWPAAAAGGFMSCLNLRRLGGARPSSTAAEHRRLGLGRGCGGGDGQSPRRSTSCF